MDASLRKGYNYTPFKFLYQLDSLALLSKKITTIGKFHVELFRQFSNIYKIAHTT